MRKWRATWRVVGIAFGLAVLVAAAGALWSLRNHGAVLEGCRTRAAFLSSALLRAMEERGWLPEDVDECLSAMLSRLYWSSEPLNCPSGAGERKLDGWQTLSASLEAWGAILKALEGQEVPVVWCARPHEALGRRERIVVTLAPHAAALYRDAASGRGGPAELSFSLLEVREMREEDLEARLEQVRGVVRSAAWPSRSMDE